MSAELDFREHDRDRDGVQQFWRADVAGLYGLVPVGSSDMIKLVELSVAGADLAPVGKREHPEKGPAVVHPEGYTISSPKAGHWFAALRFEDERGAQLRSDRFAFCAVPDTLSVGKLVYAITHEGVIWEAQARCGKDVPRAFPLDPEQAGWRRSSK